MGIPAHKIHNSLIATPGAPRKDIMNRTIDAGLHIKQAIKKNVGIRLEIQFGKKSGELSASTNPTKSMIHPGHDRIIALRLRTP